jgi:hypothetical protein
VIVSGEESSFAELYEARFGRYDSDEYSGYCHLNVAKLLGAIQFFCMADAVPKTKLNKLLFYADFAHFKEYAVSITGAHYVHLPHGPVPDNYQYYIAILHHEEQVIGIQEQVFDNGYVGEYLTTKGRPDMSLFSTSELKVLATVKECFAQETASSISARSHQEKGYQETDNGRLISYAYATQLNV